MAKQKKIKPAPIPPSPLSRLFKLKKTVLISLVIVLAVISLITTGLLLMSNRFYPGTSIANINISFLTKTQAKQKLSHQLAQRTEKPLAFTSDNGPRQIIIQSNNLTQIIDQAVDQSPTFIIPSLTSFTNSSIPNNKASNLSIADNYEITKQIDALSTNINQPPIDASLKIEADQILITPSQEGTVVDKQKLISQIDSFLNTGKLTENQIPLTKAYPKLSFETAVEIKKRLDQIRLSPLQLTFKDQSFTLDLPTLLSLIDLENSETHLASADFNNTQVEISTVRIADETIADAKLLINKQKADQYFTKLAAQIDRDVQEPLFTFDPNAPETNRVKEFKPPVEGQKLQIDQATEKLSQALLTQYQTKMELPVETVTPKNKLTNELGIKELVGTGFSRFAGSIENRIFNVSHGASKINGVLIPPGEVFSFNKTVGDITAATGFKQAYVIKSGRTVLDDGGGICQVSTTLFRAVLDAGLPVVSRTAHAYRVGYYEQGFSPGIDATIFYPSVDFQFKNDTPNYLLIQTSVNGTSLTINLFGTSDGRTVSMTKPVVLNQTPAPPEIRQDDPSLPKGTVKQVDWAATGANVVFYRKVTRNGEIIQNDTFKSNYRPWQAVYLVGTKEG